jgi:exonuclease III
VKIICENVIEKKTSHIIVASVYIPPINAAVKDSRKNTVLNFSATMSYLNEQFSSLPIIIYADLNSKCRANESKNRNAYDLEILNIIDKNGLSLIYDNAVDQYTWSNRKHKSYIDYFIVKNIQFTQFNVLTKLGSSDHNALEITIENAHPLIVRKMLK